MKKFLVPTLVMLVALLFGVVLVLSFKVIFSSQEELETSERNVSSSREEEESKESEVEGSTNEDTTEEDVGPAMAFIYQNVGDFKNGVSEIAVRLGMTTDGKTVSSYGQDVLAWTINTNVKSNVYGDPVMSRLSNGNWAMTSWTSPDDTRGNGMLLYHESECPFVVDEDVIAITPSHASGCSNVQRLTGGKTSQIFEAEGGNYVFHMITGEIYLAHLADETHSARELETMCVLSNPISQLSDLGWGESTKIFSQDETGLLMSDTAMARRSDGTWVLFVKGIEKSSSCTPNSICELCGRSIYRATSTDLIEWSDLEEVVGEASVPEATQTVDGTVWLYWQDFDAVCEASNMALSSRAAISGAYEQAGTNELSEPIHVSFPDEDFETNKKLHSATNANPIMLPNADAQEAFEACVAK